MGSCKAVLRTFLFCFRLVSVLDWGLDLVLVGFETGFLFCTYSVFIKINHFRQAKTRNFSGKGIPLVSFYLLWFISFVSFRLVSFVLVPSSLFILFHQCVHKHHLHFSSHLIKSQQNEFNFRSVSIYDSFFYVDAFKPFMF
jgi:hypothetical protein